MKFECEKQISVFILALPGACLLTLQKEFADCYGKVGLDAATYLGNGSNTKGALIGSNTAEVQEYCS